MGGAVGQEVGMARVGELVERLASGWRSRRGAPGGAAVTRRARGGQAAAAAASKLALAAVAAGLLVALAATLFHAAAAHLGERRARARGEAELAAMRSSLEDLQARLLVAQARVSHWQELQVRRAEVTRLSKAAVASHLAEQARAESERFARARGPALAGSRLAAAGAPVPGRGGSTGGGAGADQPSDALPGRPAPDPQASPLEAPGAGLGGD